MGIGLNLSLGLGLTGGRGGSSFSATLSMTQLAAANRVYQRATTTGGSQSKGAGVIPVTVNATVATPVYARIRSSDGSTILQASTRLSDISSTGSQTISVPADARLGWFYVDISENNSNWTLGTTLVGMGRIVAVSGQSLAVRMFGRMDSQTATNASLGVTIDPNGSVYATYVDGQRSVTTPGWAIPADGSNYDSAFASEFLRRQVAISGVNCALVGHSKGSQAISVFVPGGAENATLRARLDEVGGFESFIWYQGHSDAAAGTTSATYQSQLSTLFVDMNAHNAVRGASYTKYIGTIPNINYVGFGTTAQRMVIRGAAATWAGANSATHVQVSDLDLIDGVHQSMAGAATLAQHMHRASRVEFGLTSADFGPTLTSATRVTTAITIATALPNGGSYVLTGSPPNRLSVYAAGTTTSPLAIASVTASGSTLTVNLSADPGDTQALDVWAFRANEATSTGNTDMIRDSVTDGDGITVGRQLVPSLSALSVPAVSGSTQVGPNLSSVSSPTFRTGATGYGQELNGGGYATAASVTGIDVLPAGTAWTMEAIISVASAPASVLVAVGLGGRGWIGVASDGRLVGAYTKTGNTSVYFNSTTASGGGTNPVITDGVRRRVALVVTASAAYLFVDGTLIGTSAVAPIATAGTNQFNIGTLNNSATFQWVGSVEEVAVWNATSKYTANYTPASAPYVGSETGLTGLWHLDGNFNAAVY